MPLRALPFVLPLLFQVVFGYSALYAGLLLLAMNGADLMLKSLTSWSLRRFGFRNVLLGSATVVVLTVAACALFSSRDTYWLVFGLLGLSGMARSLLLTGLSTLAFADVPRAELASSSVLWNLMMQLSNALGVSLAAILMNLTSLALGTALGHVTFANCELTLLAMAAIGAAAIPGFVRLPHDAGALVSGHRATRPAAGPPARS